MSPLQKQKLKKRIKTFAIPAVIVVVAPFALPLLSLVAGKVSGYQDLVMGALQACPHARAMLGDNVGPSYVGLAMGSSETQGGHGRASWRVPVSGSRGRGTYRYTVMKMGGPWQINSAVLEAGGQMLDIANCAPGAGGSAVAAGPQAIQAAVAAGECYQRGDKECALVNSQAACAQGHTDSCGNAAHLLLELRGDAAGAAQLARTACEAGSASGCENLGTALRKLGDADGAFQAMSRSCQMELDVACALLANMHLERGDTAGAIQLVNRALQLNPNRSSAFRQAGHAYLFSGQVDQALGYYARAVQTAAIADQGRGVVEDAREPPLTTIQNEITALSRVYPAHAAAVQQVLTRLPALAGGAAPR